MQSISSCSLRWTSCRVIAGRSISISAGLQGTGVLRLLPEHQGKIHTDLAGRLALFGRPEERFPSIAATERLALTVVNVPGGKTFGLRLLADRVNQLHHIPSLLTSCAKLLPWISVLRNDT